MNSTAGAVGKKRSQQDGVHQLYMSLALQEAKKSPPKPTNFCVGACLVAEQRSNVQWNEDSLGHGLLAKGYTLECEGNTHAEQCCFVKYAQTHQCKEDEIGRYLPERAVLYTTMEPCNKRSVGNLPCVDRILRIQRADGKQAIEKVYVGVAEPETFVGVNEGKKRLEDAGIAMVHVPGFQEEILKVATAGHPKTEDEAEKETA